MGRFSDALSRPMEDIQRPAPLPLGHYILSVTKQVSPPETLNSTKGDFEKITVNCSVVSACEDVDPDELAEFGNPAGTPLRIDFIFNNDPEEKAKFEGTLNRLKSFLGHCGLDVESGVLAEKLSELMGSQFKAEVKHRPDSNDPMVIYNEVGRTAPV